MDKIFYNGKIGTQDDHDTFAQAVGIKDGKIAFVGSNEEAAALSADERIDLNGRLMLPGFVDSHLHMLHYAFVENSVKLFDCTSVEELMDLARTRLAEKPGMPWLFCRGWNENKFAEPRYPHKDELDALNKDIPIIMVRVCGHTAVCNSKGLELLKQIPQFPDIASEVNEENGVLKENAVQFFYAILDAPAVDQVVDFLKLGISHLNRAGITGIQSDDLASLPGKNWRRILEAYHKLDASGEMHARVYEQCLFERYEDLKVFIAEGHRTGQKGEFFTIGPVKLIQDGSLGARTAAMLEPYEGQPDNVGIITFPQEELNDIVRFCDDNHMQVAIHCIGDRAMDMVIKAVEASPSRKDNPKSRHGIVHVQISNPEILEGMKRNDILAYIQPVFIDLDMDVVESRIGKRRMNKIYAWKSLLDLGVHTSGGSDAPVVRFDVMENIYFAVTRKNMAGEPAEGWLPEEKVSVTEAVKLFTKYPAYASYSENEAGTIEVGKNADLVVLGEDLYTIDPDHIKDVSVDMTLMNGKVVFTR